MSDPGPAFDPGGLPIETAFSGGTPTGSRVGTPDAHPSDPTLRAIMHNTYVPVCGASGDPGAPR
jgi:hypothetical protein